MKYLVVGVLLAFTLVLIYARLRPYLELLQKLSQAMRGAVPAGGSQKSVKAQTQLIRCPACGIWAPSSRTPATASLLSGYCSRECLEKATSKQSRERVG